MEQMIWIILVVVLIGVSLTLAFYSMRSYQEIPIAISSYSLFLVRNKLAVNPQLLDKIHQLTIKDQTTFSLERLFKGGETALVIFAPTGLIRQLPELKPLELEDYLKPPKISVDDSFTLMIAPKSDSKKSLLVKPDLFKDLDLLNNQYFFWQIVCSPQPNFFQITIRAMVIDKDANQKIDLAKKIDAEIGRGTGLISQKRKQTSQNYFLSFAKRALVPKEINEFILSSAEIASLTF